MNNCACGEPSEWLDKYCQECWEEECETSWQQTIKLLSQPMLVLIKIIGNKASVLFRIKDITRITPILINGNLDCYGLDLTCEPHWIKLTPTQFERLIPFLIYVDLSRDLDQPEELTAPLEEDFNKNISELLDMAIKSPNPCPHSTDPWLVLKK